jgi:hypothetical protein
MDYISLLKEHLSWTTDRIVNFYIKGESMDKQEAIKRLDALEGEAKKLREIIERGDELIYDKRKIYVGVKDGQPYIMAGRGYAQYFRFHAFSGNYRTEQGWDNPKSSGQGCLDYHRECGFDIRAFDDTREAFEYFINFLPGSDLTAPIFSHLKNGRQELRYKRNGKTYGRIFSGGSWSDEVELA